MRTFLCSGTFDPITNGHVDVIRRARRLCDRLIVLVLENSEKGTVRSLAERLETVRRVFADSPDIEVDAYDGLLVDYVQRIGAAAIVRGIRNEGDFAYENVMAAANRALLEGCETIFLPARGELAYMSSSIVRGIAAAGGDIKSLVPQLIADETAVRYAMKRGGKV